MQVINLLGLISQLEDQKWDCVLQGAEENPALRMRMELIDRKLDRLYAWFATAYQNGLVTKNQRSPGMPPITNRRRKKA